MKTIAAVLVSVSAALSNELVNSAQVAGVSLEYPALDTSAIRVLSEKMHAVRIGLTGIYRLKEGLSTTHFYYQAYPVEVDSGKGPFIRDSGSYAHWVFPKRDTAYVYRVVGGEDGKLSDFLTFAYMYESGKFRYDEARFERSPPKSYREFWKRNLISQGWGAQYVFAENPYVSNGWITIGFGYAWDAFTYFAMLGGPFIGKHTTDKVTIPLVGLAGALAFRVGFNGGVASWDIGIFNRVANSGYPAPKTGSWDIGALYEDMPAGSVPEKAIP
jgi:hypothetical protein